MTSFAIAAIDSPILLAAIRDGAKPKVDDHLTVKHDAQAVRIAQQHKSRHLEETRQAKATSKKLHHIVKGAHAKIETHADEVVDSDLRQALVASSKARHQEEAHMAKAAQRKLDTIRGSTHSKVDARQTEEDRMLAEALHQTAEGKLRDARRCHKAHLRKFKAVTRHASAKVDVHLSAEVEHERNIYQSTRAERTREVAKARWVVNALQANSGAAPIAMSEEETAHYAATLLQAARRGSLGRTVARSRQAQPLSACNGGAWSGAAVRKALTAARNNRLAQRRSALCGDEIGKEFAAALLRHEPLATQ